MLPHIICAVTSLFFLSGSLMAAGSHISARVALDPAQSALTLRAQTDVLPGQVRQVGITHGELHADGAMDMVLALNAFSGDARMPGLRRWTHLMDDLQSPRGLIRTALTREMVFYMMSGPRAVFDLPLEVTMNGFTHILDARMTGAMDASGRVTLRTAQAVSFDLSRFGFAAQGALVAMHIDVSYGHVSEVAPKPETWVHMASLARPAPEVLPRINHAVNASLRPLLRPTAVAGTRPSARPATRPTLRPIASAEVQTRSRLTERAKVASAAPKAQLVTITHKLRPTPSARAKDCRDRDSRVARRNTHLVDGGEGERRIKRAMRQLIGAFRPCR